jgi:F0F1-type ATP synthase epsilon subunit
LLGVLALPWVLLLVGFATIKSMKIEVSSDEAMAIRYAVEEMANRRSQNAVDYFRNKEMANAAATEAAQLRALAVRISKEARSQD